MVSNAELSFWYTARVRRAAANTLILVKQGRDSMRIKDRVLYLCAGLQSGGTTLISWCFLQRTDMDGIFDANNDVFADIPTSIHSPFAWLKTTIGSFRLSEQIDYFEDLGWTVRPLLICRDVREAYASLRTKPYCRNGTTAEDPPLRLRFRRFREDWELFRANGWPILRYEQFLLDPEEVLAETCAKLHLPWDDAMLTWPKPKTAILDMRHGNRTFRQSCGNNLWESLNPGQKSADRLAIPVSEHIWLENEFARFNQDNGYPAHIPLAPSVNGEDGDLPRFDATRRVKWRRPRMALPQVPLRYLRKRVARWFTKDEGRVMPSPSIPAGKAIALASSERIMKA
jgi:hypothetical protein